MSSTPQAPAQVSDETIVLRDNFVPDGAPVPAGNGWTWIVQAWNLFRKAPGTWIAMIIVLFVIFCVLAFIPVLGSLAGVVLGPVFTAGLVMASRTLEQGGEAQFGQLFGGFRHRFGALAGVGAIYLVATVAIVFVVSIASGLGLATLVGAERSQDPAGIAATLAIAVLLIFALMLPVIMAIWFAPPLVCFHELGPLEAMKSSFLGCLKNLLPFLFYGAILLVAVVVATLPLMLGWLVLGPVGAASIYTAYRDIYFSRSVV